MATSVENRGEDKAPVELSAPDGWKKMVLPKKSGTPRRNAIIFISPTGEEIKSKRQLDLYLKSHPGGPSSSEFDWSTGETPRRSRRLSEKSKEMESPESEPPSKRQNKSSLEKVEDDADGGDEVVEEKDDAKEDTKTCEDVEMKEVEDVSELKKGKGYIKNAATGVSGGKDTDTDTSPKSKEQGTDNKTTNEKDERVACNKPSELVGNKEEADKQKEPEASSDLQSKKADEKTISSLEEEMESDSLPTQELDDGKQGTEKQPADGEARASNDNLKEAEDGSRPVTNYSNSIHHEEKTPHEPKASQVSC